MSKTLLAFEPTVDGDAYAFRTAIENAYGPGHRHVLLHEWSGIMPGTKFRQPYIETVLLHTAYQRYVEEQLEWEHLAMLTRPSSKINVIHVKVTEL